MDSTLIALGAPTALNIWKTCALEEGRFLLARDQRWFNRDFSSRETSLPRASHLAQQRRLALPANYDPRISPERACALAQRFGLELPLSATVLTHSHRDNKLLKSTLLNDAASVGEFLQLEPGVFIPSPELCIASLANSMDELDLLIAAYELCSLYAPDPETGDLLERPQIAFPEKLQALLPELPRLHCRGKLAFVAKHLLGRSRSPRETALALLLTLPYSRGGYKLPLPELNADAPLSAQGKRTYGKGVCECDLLWPRQKLAVFYESNEHHLNSYQFSKDVRRDLALDQSGYSIIRVSSQQLSSAATLKNLAKGIARHLGKEIRICRADFPARNAALRSRLL